MPCNSDYMEANQNEKNLSVVYGLLDELKTGKLPKNFGDGYNKRVYNKDLPLVTKLNLYYLNMM